MSNIVEYFTPFATTILYSRDDLFESVIALMAERAQIAELSVDFVWPEYITPQLILFSYQEKIIDEAKKRGFPQILVFSALITDAPPDIIIFDRNNIHQYIDFVRGGTGLTVIEMVMVYQFGETGGKFVTCDDARAFCLALIERPDLYSQLFTQLSENISAIISTIRGADIIEKYIARGRLLEDRRILAEKIMSDGIEMDSVFYVCGEYDAIKQALPKYLRKYSSIICYKRAAAHWMIVNIEQDKMSSMYLNFTEAMNIMPKIFV